MIERERETEREGGKKRGEGKETGKEREIVKGSNSREWLKSRRAETLS